MPYNPRRRWNWDSSSLFFNYHTMLHVTLNIQEDSELRNEIRGMIKGQVLGIVREELLQDVKEELKRKVEAMKGSVNLEYLLKNTLRDLVSDILYREFKIDTWNHDFIKPFVEKRLEAALAGKNWNQLIDTLATEKIKAFLKNP